SGHRPALHSFPTRRSSDLISLRERRGQMPVRELLHLKFAGVRVDDAHSFYEQMNGRIRLEYLSPSWLILSDGFRKSALLVLAKRSEEHPSELQSPVAVVCC